METKRSTKACCWLVQVHHHHHFASFLDMVVKKPNTRSVGLSWPTITRQIQDPISMHTDHNVCAASCFSEN